MTLGGLALGAGMLVDNAIVVMENIFRNMEENHLSPTEAAIRGTSEAVSYTHLPNSNTRVTTRIISSFNVPDKATSA